jgi:PRC-barrel domain protein
MSDEPVSWLVVEPGWKVVAAGGKELGKVDEVVGDTGQDIFSGLSVSQGLLRKRRYVPAELVREIVEGEIRLGVAADAFDRLDGYEPPSAEILPPDTRR